MLPQSPIQATEKYTPILPKSSIQAIERHTGIQLSDITLLVCYTSARTQRQPFKLNSMSDKHSNETKAPEEQTYLTNLIHLKKPGTTISFTYVMYKNSSHEATLVWS